MMEGDGLGVLEGAGGTRGLAELVDGWEAAVPVRVGEDARLGLSGDVLVGLDIQ
jgi:hypothetical protein